MKKLINIFLLFLLTSFYANATDIQVGKNFEIKSIKEAIALAQNGDTITIHKGLYREGNIGVGKSLYIRGIAYPVLDGENKTEILSIKADNITITGLHLKNVGTSYVEDRAGIAVYESKNININYNILQNAFFGIFIKNCQNIRITNNLVYGKATDEASSGNAIQLWYCNKAFIANNRVKHHRDGIYLEFADSTTVKNNLSENNLRYGLHFMFSNFCDYQNNTFQSNGAGVAVMFSKYISMTGNHFEKNWGMSSYGLLLKEIYDGEVSHNTFSENTIGIYFEGATRMEIKNNLFKSNGWALKFTGSAMDNEVVQNNFISNTFNFETTSKRNNNIIRQNYWSDYTGYDLDKDGFGDIPYRPVKLYNYIIDRVPSSIILMRSLFIDIVNFAEKVTPIFTPENLVDESPLMKQVRL